MKVRVEVDLPVELVERIDEFCGAEGLELATFVADAVTAWLDDDEHAMVATKLLETMRLTNSAELQVVCPSCGADVIVSAALKS